MLDYHWPGNIRELKSALEYAFVITDKEFIEPNQLPPALMGSPLKTAAIPLPFVPTHGTEKDALLAALKQANGNKSEAGRILGVNRMTVWNRMKKFGIDLKKGVYD